MNEETETQDNSAIELLYNEWNVLFMKYFDEFLYENGYY